jgi:hypothetical protein
MNDLHEIETDDLRTDLLACVRAGQLNWEDVPAEWRRRLEVLRDASA